MRWLLALSLAVAAACGIAEAMGHNTRGAPCTHSDRRCAFGPSTPTPATYALQIFWGGVDAGQVATGGAVTTKAGDPVTLTRASTTTCQNSNGTLNYLASGAPCVEWTPKGAGLAVRPTTVNIASASSNMAASPWTNYHVTSTPGQQCPDGTDAGILMVDDSTNNQHEVYYSLGDNDQGPGSYTFSVYAKPAASSPANYLCLGQGVNNEQANFDLVGGALATGAGTFQGFSAGNTDFHIEAAANGFWRVSYTSPEANGTSFVQLWEGVGYNNSCSGYSGSGQGLILCAPQITFTSDLRAYIPNDGGLGVVGTRAADVYQTANHLDGGSAWVLGISPTIDGLRWDTGRQRGLMQLGWDAGDSNTATWYVTDAGFMVLSVVDNAGGVKSATSNTILWPGRHYLRAVNSAGTLSLYQDDAGLSVTVAGSGTGLVSTMPAFVYPGSQGSSGNQVGGPIEDVCANSDTTGCAYSGSTPSLVVNQKSLVALGDSLTNNGPAFGTSYWPQMLAAIYPTWTVTNAGVAGSNITSGTTKYVDGGWYSNPARYVSLENGINDVTTLVYTMARTKFFTKYLWDSIASSGSTPVIIRESPWANSTSWTTLAQTNYDTLQAWVAAEAALYGYPYSDMYTFMADGGVGPPPTLRCDYDYGSTGTENVCGGAPANGVHLNDAGQGGKLGVIRPVLGL